MVKFTDLIFNPHPVHTTDGVRATHKFFNGYTISVVGGGTGLYGDGVNTFEVAIFKPNGKFYQYKESDSVKGWCTDAEITKIMLNIQNIKL